MISDRMIAGRRDWREVGFIDREYYYLRSHQSPLRESKETSPLRVIEGLLVNDLLGFAIVC